jgi:hypothetical protein
MFFILRQNSYIRIAVEHTFQVSVLLTLNAWMIHFQIFILCLQKYTFALDVTGYITTHFEIEQCFNLKTIIFFICCILPNDKRCRRYVLSYTINCIVYDYSYRMNMLLGLVLLTVISSFCPSCHVTSITSDSCKMSGTSLKD